MFELESGTIFAGHRIEELAGRGGMGVVYRAIQLDLGRPVALKLIASQLAEDPDFRERFKRESQLTASLDHPNVIPVFQAGEADGRLFITMRYVPGTDLDDLIAERGRLDPEHAVETIRQIGAALDAAHARGLVHRDVKPGNILVTANGQQHAYLTDFGLTKDTTAQGGLTGTGQFVGTIDYAAPEQLQGERPDARADVYSLGCVLFRAVTGHLPYERDSDVAKLFAHLHDPPPAVTGLLPSAPSMFDEVIRTALAKEPDERYQSAGDLALAAAAALNEAALPRPERSVATGAAAPGPAPTHLGGVAPTAVGASARETDATGPAKTDVGTRRRRLAGLLRAPRVALAGAVAVVAVAVGAVLLVAGGDDTGQDAAVAPQGGEPPAQAPPTSATDWRELSPIPTARQQVPAAAAGGAVWLVGGLVGDTATDTVEGYDPVVNSWKTAPDLPVPLHHATAVSYQGELVVLGGWVPEGGDVSATTSDRVLALRGGEWIELPRLRHPRAAGAAAVVDDSIVVVGGQADGSLIEEVEVFDGERWRDAEPLPTPRDHLAAASDGRFVYAVGGRELSADRNLDTLERYDPEGDSWEALPGMPTPRGGLGATVVGGRLVAVGGEEPTRVLAAAESFDIASQEWSVLSDIAVPRHGVGVAALGSSLYVVGGAREAGHLNSADAAEAIRFVEDDGG